MAMTRSVGSQTSDNNNNNNNNRSTESSSTNYILISKSAYGDDQQHVQQTSNTIVSVPNEKSPVPGSPYDSVNTDDYEWVSEKQSTKTDKGNHFKYASKLAQLHEMGITYCDDLAVELLMTHDGNIDVIVPMLLETIYPD
ncbi:uncharacterized protein BX664DRAFT_319031 [Halteromyces radiatus]|uniref:uncharacterized protein n=1 Tax=Halteromyces radiatus TaxID=101107 RepID=UPI002220564F|nr:uncharacterized protein BX664DRAFT_319031 [Halteromyces radiatus]KAI8098564.1 hypothetical protein BX664DRAFT_319031 [Halteromyces radiatus]